MSHTIAATAPTLTDIQQAASRIAPVAVRTPLLEVEALNRHVGGRLLCKAEVLQRTGSFKFRGAYNFLSRLEPAARQAGVVAYSSGNHAQGVAAAASLWGCQATIVMPADTPAIKIEGTRFWGAEVVLYDRQRESREEIAQDIVAKTGATLIPPYDHPYTIEGQGTVGLELVQQATDQGAVLDALLVPCSGGGLIAGTATAVRALYPDTAIYAVEPQGYDDTALSLIKGERTAVSGDTPNACDALLMPIPGEITFPINQRLLAGGLVVTESEVFEAMAWAFRHLKLVVEPGGAVALAAALFGKLDCRGKTVAIVLSGGNVDPAVFSKIFR